MTSAMSFAMTTFENLFCLYFFFPLLIGTEAMRLVEWVETISELWKWDSLYEFKPFRDKTIDLNQNQPPK